MKRIAVLTSGGDAPGMNAAIRAIVRTCIYKDVEIYGIRRGYEGLLDGDFFEMNVASVGDIIHRGGTILRTARSKRFQTEEGVLHAVKMLENFSIEGLIVIGGDGSLKGALELSKCGVPVIGLPGTIDNDLAYTEYTIGFDTAVNTVLNAIGNIRDTSSAHDRVAVIEVMGRNCGDIALYTALAGGAENVLIPEIEVDINNICMKLIQGRNRGKLHSIIIRAEGVKISSEDLVKEIEDRTGMEAKVAVLGYIQRGGTPTARDRIFASVMGSHGAELLIENKFNRAVGVRCEGVVDYDLENALQMEKGGLKYSQELLSILSI